MDMRKLVAVILEARREKGFTQEHFAEISGFTQQYVSGLERGRRNPTVVTSVPSRQRDLVSATSISCSRMTKRAASGRSRRNGKR